jgi:hypothetical protein
MLAPAQAGGGVDVNSAVAEGLGRVCMTPSSEAKLKGE